MGDPKITSTRRIEKDRANRWRSWKPGVVKSVADIVNPMLRAWDYEPV
jgi:hypothetical protein